MTLNDTKGLSEYAKGYQDALKAVIMVGCICHEDDRQGLHGECAVCQAVEALKVKETK